MNIIVYAKIYLKIFDKKVKKTMKTSAEIREMYLSFFEKNIIQQGLKVHH